MNDFEESINRLNKLIDEKEKELKELENKRARLENMISNKYIQEEMEVLNIRIKDLRQRITWKKEDINGLKKGPLTFERFAYEAAYNKLPKNYENEHLQRFYKTKNRLDKFLYQELHINSGSKYRLNGFTTTVLSAICAATFGVIMTATGNIAIAGLILLLTGGTLTVVSKQICSYANKIYLNKLKKVYNETLVPKIVKQQIINKYNKEIDSMQEMIETKEETFFKDNQEDLQIYGKIIQTEDEIYDTESELDYLYTNKGNLTEATKIAEKQLLKTKK